MPCSSVVYILQYESSVPLQSCKRKGVNPGKQLVGLQDALWILDIYTDRLVSTSRMCFQSCRSSTILPPSLAQQPHVNWAQKKYKAVQISTGPHSIHKVKLCLPVSNMTRMDWWTPKQSTRHLIAHWQATLNHGCVLAVSVLLLCNSSAQGWHTKQSLLKLAWRVGLTNHCSTAWCDHG